MLTALLHANPCPGLVDHGAVERRERGIFSQRQVVLRVLLQVRPSLSSDFSGQWMMRLMCCSYRNEFRGGRKTARPHHIWFPWRKRILVGSAGLPWTGRCWRRERKAGGGGKILRVRPGGIKAFSISASKEASLVSWGR